MPAIVVTSQRTAQLGFVDKVIESLMTKHDFDPDDFFTQRDIDETKTKEHWMTQWLKAAQQALVVPCFVDIPYVNSNPCCKEYMIADTLGKLVLIALESPDTLGGVSAEGFNGKLIAHFLIGGQCLLAMPGGKYADPDAIANVIAKMCAKKQGESEPTPAPAPGPSSTAGSSGPPGPAGSPAAPAVLPQGPDDGDYKLLNRKWIGPLKAITNGADRVGNHQVWCSSNDSYQCGGQEVWTIKRQSSHSDLFKLYNKKWVGPLKAVTWAGLCYGRPGDHQVWTAAGRDYAMEGQELWTFEQVGDYWKLRNHRWAGPLKAITSGADGDGDHQVWCSSKPGYSYNGQELWKLEKV